MPNLNEEAEQELRRMVLAKARFATDSDLSVHSRILPQAVRVVVRKISEHYNKVLEIPNMSMTVEHLSNLIVAQFNAEPTASTPA